MFQFPALFYISYLYKFMFLNEKKVRSNQNKVQIDQRKRSEMTKTKGPNRLIGSEKVRSEMVKSEMTRIWYKLDSYDRHVKISKKYTLLTQIFFIIMPCMKKFE